MDEVFAANRAELCGVLCEAPRYSHESRGIRFYRFPLETVRLSGAADRLNVVVRDRLTARLPGEGERVRIHRAKEHARILRLHSRSFVEILQRKLSGEEKDK